MSSTRASRSSTSSSPTSSGGIAPASCDSTCGCRTLDATWPRRINLILLVGPLCGWLGAKDWNPPLVNIYAVTSILWFFFAVALFGWFLYLGITDKWRRYFVSDVTPGWFWFSCFWQVRTPCQIDPWLSCGVKLHAIDAARQIERARSRR